MLRKSSLEVRRIGTQMKHQQQLSDLGYTVTNVSFQVIKMVTQQTQITCVILTIFIMTKRFCQHT